MTQEQYEYKLKSIDVRLSELENELDTVITIMKSNEKYDKDIIDRNKPLTDEDINNMLPDESEGDNY